MVIKPVEPRDFAAKIQPKFLRFVRKAPVFVRGQEREAAAWVWRNNPGSYSTSCLMEQLWLARKIPHNAQAAFSFAARGYELYQRTEWLQATPENLEPREMMEWLARERPPENKYSMAVLAAMLWAGGRIPTKKKQFLVMLAGSYDLYEKYRWLKKAPEFSTVEAAVKYLIEQQGADRKESLSYLMQCLWIGKKIPEDRLQAFQMKAGAADYALRYRERISYEFVRAFHQLDKFSERGFRRAINRSIFVAQDGSGRKLSGSHTNRIIVVALGLYGRDLIADLVEGEVPDIPGATPFPHKIEPSPSQIRDWAASFPELTNPFDIAVWINEHPCPGISNRRALGELVYHGRVPEAQCRIVSNIRSGFTLLLKYPFLAQAPVFEDPLEMLAWLNERHPAGVKMTALATAMVLAGKIDRGKYVQTQWLATAFNKLKDFPWISTAPEFHTYREMIDWIESAPEGKDFPYSLGFLGSLLLAAGKISSGRYGYLLGDYEFAKGQAWMLAAPEFTDYEEMRGWIGAQNQTAPFRKIVRGLYALGKAPCYFTVVASAEYYIEIYSWLKDAPAFADLKEMYDWLKGKIDEQKVPLKAGTFLTALQLLGKTAFPGFYLAGVSAYQFIEDSPWIKNVPVFEGVEEGLKWLLHNQPQKTRYRLSAIITAMIIEEKIPHFSYVYAAASAIRHKGTILRELAALRISSAEELGNLKQIKERFPRDVLTRKETGMPLSEGYFYQVIAWAMRIYGDEFKIERPRAQRLKAYAEVSAIAASPGLDYTKKGNELRALLSRKTPEERTLIRDLIEQGAIGKFGLYIGRFAKLKEMLPAILAELATT